MAALQTTVSLILLGLGGALSLVNAWLFVNHLLGRQVPSMVPLIPGGMLFIGALMFPDPAVRPYAWMGLFLDCGSIPYVTLATISLWRENRRYAHANKLLWLTYETETMQGDVSVYPGDECIFKWGMNDRSSSGSIVMKVSRYVEGGVLEIGVQDTELSLEHRDDAWSIVGEQGWDDPAKSLANARFSERPL